MGNKNNEKLKKEKNKKGWLVLISFLLAGGFYLYTINETAVQGYRIKENEKKIAQLKKDNEALQIKKAELTSLYRIEEESQQKDMEKVDQVVYLKENKTVAYKK